MGLIIVYLFSKYTHIFNIQLQICILRHVVLSIYNLKCLYVGGRKWPFLFNFIQILQQIQDLLAVIIYNVRTQSGTYFQIVTYTYTIYNWYYWMTPNNNYVRRIEYIAIYVSNIHISIEFYLCTNIYTSFHMTIVLFHT